MTFKESVFQKIFIAADQYNKLIGTDFVITSSEFKKCNTYVLRFYKDNFLHLTGVNTKLHAKDFFIKKLLTSI